MKNITQQMIERRSAREFDVHYHIPEDDLTALVDAIRMTPSAWGLLTQRLIVLKDKQVKQALAPLFYNQLNFTTADAYLIFLGTDPDGLAAKIHKSLDMKFGVGVESEIRTRYTDNIHNALLSDTVSDAVRLEFSIKQSFISVGVATAVAADLGIDTCIMQGFDAVALRTYLIKHDIIAHDEIPLIAMACGKSIKVSGAKTRLASEDFVIEV